MPVAGLTTTIVGDFYVFASCSMYLCGRPARDWSGADRERGGHGPGGVRSHAGASWQPAAGH